MNTFFKNAGNIETNTAGILNNSKGPVIEFRRLRGDDYINITQDDNKKEIQFSFNQGNLSTSGNSLSFTEEQISSPYTATAGQFILVNIESFGSGAFIVNLPAGNTLSGNEQIGIKLTSTVYGNYLKISPNGSDLIDNSGSIELTTDYESVIIQYGASGKWWRIG